MSSEVVQSQRAVMREAAKIGNALIRAELTDSESPITARITSGFANWRQWTPLWNPFYVNWGAKSGFGLAVRDEDSVSIFGDRAAYDRCAEIAADALTVAMERKAKEWVGPMLRDLFSAQSVYQQMVTSEGPQTSRAPVDETPEFTLEEDQAWERSAKEREKIWERFEKRTGKKT